jgi:hypothetical protein
LRWPSIPNPNQEVDVTNQRTDTDGIDELISDHRKPSSYWTGSHQSPIQTSAEISLTP